MKISLIQKKKLKKFNSDKLREECGIFGIANHEDASAMVALGLHALQHRGQEGCGIVTCDGKKFYAERRLGLVGDNFTKGKVLETSVTDCEVPSVVIDHGVSLDNKKLITIYSHVGEFVVKEGDTVKRGDMIAKLPKKIAFPCMARVRHLHLQIGQKYCEKEEAKKKEYGESGWGAWVASFWTEREGGGGGGGGGGR